MVLAEQNLNSKQGKKILVVEDDPTLKPILTRFIYQIDPDIHVDWLDSADECLQWKGAGAQLGPWNAYDLVLADIYTPGDTGGLDVLKFFHDHAPQTPVVMMSTVSMMEFFQKIGNEELLPSFLAKPLDPTECNALISGLLARKDDHGAANKEGEV